MNTKLGRVLAGLCAIAVATTCAAPALAQTSEMKEKPPMYSYVGNWAIPRAQWAEMDKNTAADEKILSKALASGTIVAYGNDVNLVHQAEGATHDDWWSAMTMAGCHCTLGQHGGGAPAWATPHRSNTSNHLFIGHLEVHFLP